MKKKIIIISASYPFGKTETFLANEIECLSKDFDVHIIPVMYNNNNELQALPEGVTFQEPIVNTGYWLKLIVSIFSLKALLLDVQSVSKAIFHGKKGFVYFLQVSLIYRSFLGWKFLKRNQNIPGDIVYYYWSSPLLILSDKMFPNKPTYARVHGGEVNTKRFAFIPLLKEKLSADVVFLSISDDAKRMILKINSNAKILMSRLGVTGADVVQKDRKEKEVLVCSCSNIIDIKRVHLIFDALMIVESVKVKWVHFGDGVLMRDLVERLNDLPDNVTVELKGRVPNSIVKKFYQENFVDLFINVSTTEGVPVSIMEAQAFGIPVFATDVGGTSEVVNNDNGFLVDVNFSVQELSDVIKDLINSDLKKKREGSYNNWASLYNADKNYENLIKIFNEKLQD